MKRRTIESRVAIVEKRLATAREPQDLATLNRCLEQLVMMESDEDRWERTGREMLKEFADDLEGDL